MTAADCVKHKWLQYHPAATPTPNAPTTMAKTGSVSAKTRLKSESPTTLASESSEDSTETIEEADVDDDVNEDVATEQDDEESEELAQLCSTHELEVSPTIYRYIFIYIYILLTLTNRTKSWMPPRII